MGTNYYLRTNICECCDRYDEKHIGKKSVGWQFGFRSYRTEEIEIETCENWLEVLLKAVLIDRTGKICNEYGAEVPFDSFVEMVKKSKDNLENKNHYDWCVEHECLNSYNQWKDAEGYSFTDSEFS